MNRNIDKNFTSCVILFDNLNLEFLEDAPIRNLFSSIFNKCLVMCEAFDDFKRSIV